MKRVQFKATITAVVDVEDDDGALLIEAGKLDLQSTPTGRYLRRKIDIVVRETLNQYVDGVSITGPFRDVFVIEVQEIA